MDLQSTNVQEPKTIGYQIYKSPKRMNIESTRVSNEQISNLQESKRMNLKSIRAENEWISNPQEPKMNESQWYKSPNRIKIKSTRTRAKNEWILNLQESKTNEYQTYKSPKWMNLQYKRAQNEWISNLLSVDVEDVSVGGEDRRGRGACLCLICGKLIGLSAGQYIGYQGHCKSFSSPGTSSTSGPARRGVKSHLVVEKICITWHVSVSRDMSAALSDTTGWPDTATLIHWQVS